MNWGIKYKGFTLIEMLVVLAIISIIVTLSTPLSNIYKSNRVSTQVQEFVGSLNVARNEAVSRGVPVSICIRNTVEIDGVPTLVCAGDAGDTDDWSAGWLVFIDRDSDCVIDPNIDPTLDDTVINQRNAMATGFSLEVQHHCIRYTAAGITPATNGLWTLCDPSGTAGLKRGISLSVSGRAQILDPQRAEELAIDLADCPA